MHQLHGELEVVLLPPGFDPGGFDCEQEDINEYLLQGDAARDVKASVSHTYIVRRAGELVGYFTVLADAVRLRTKERPDGIPYGSAPAIKLGRMGVTAAYKKMGVGEWILKFVAGMARKIGREVGVRYVTLDALPEAKLIAFYEKNRFVRNPGEIDLRKLARYIQRGIGREIPLDQVCMRLDLMLEGEAVIADPAEKS